MLLMESLLDSIFKFDFDITKGGIGIGSIDNEQLNMIIEKIVIIVVVIISMYVTIKIGSYLIDKTTKKQANFKFSLDEKKANTIAAVLKSLLRYVVYFLGVGYILTMFFGPISLTLASIGGVAIGLGSQSLVKDVINGFFILFEDQFSVGDYINVDTKGGVVESIELRVTKLRDPNGDLHIIPNGMITQVTNHSRGDMRFLIDIDIAYEEDVDKAMAVLQTACDEYRKNNETVVDGPKVLGITSLKESGVTIRIFGKSRSMTQGENENKLRRELKLALDNAGIEIPYPRRKIIN